MTELSVEEVSALLDAVAYALDDADFRLTDGYVGDWLEGKAREQEEVEHATMMQSWVDAITKLEREVKGEGEPASEKLMYLDTYVGEGSTCYETLHKEESK